MKLRREFKQTSRVTFGPAGAAPRFRRRARPTPLRRALVILGILASVLACAVGLLWIPHIRVQSVVVSGARVENPRDIEAIVESKLLGAHWLVIPRNSIFFYPQEEIAEEIEAQYPRVMNVSVSYRSATSLTVSLDERIPRALWCEDEGSCAFLDESGYAFARAPHFSGAVFFEVGGTSTPPTVGLSILPGTEFQDVLQFERDLITLLRAYPDAGLPVGIELSSENSFAFRIQAPEIEEEWRLIVKRGENPLEVLRNVDLALATLSDDPKNKERMLSYIDARLGKKLFTKFKE